MPKNTHGILGYFPLLFVALLALVLLFLVPVRECRLCFGGGVNYNTSYTLPPGHPNRPVVACESCGGSGKLGLLLFRR